MYVSWVFFVDFPILALIRSLFPLCLFICNRSGCARCSPFLNERRMHTPSRHRMDVFDFLRAGSSANAKEIIRRVLLAYLRMYLAVVEASRRMHSKLDSIKLASANTWNVRQLKTTLNYVNMHFSLMFPYNWRASCSALSRFLLIP